jgi:hypothetical protein
MQEKQTVAEKRQKKDKNSKEKSKPEIAQKKKERH